MKKAFDHTGFYPADILLPQGCDMEKWSVVACDQYTSQPDYWDRVEEKVGDAPSTLRLMLPEIYLGQSVGDRIEKINATMRDYLARGLFRTLEQSFVYTERRLACGKLRRGLVGAVDLEDYDYNSGAATLIRSTEGTVLDRIPPRVKVRENAPLELPHVMVLIDDPEKTLIEKTAADKEQFEKVYDFELMQGGGHITGYAVGGAYLEKIARALASLVSPAAFEKKYGVSGPVMAYAMGDGNHSLATAKACWEQVKKGLTKEQAQTHSARFALVELVNIHDESLEFEPIHRVVFHTEPRKLLDGLFACYPGLKGQSSGSRVGYVAGGENGQFYFGGHELAVGQLQKFLDDYIGRFGGEVDYIHGEDVVRELCKKPGTVGFLLPAMGKSELFEAVIRDGALPRKTFSMGEACDKRYYLECRRIK